MCEWLLSISHRHVPWRQCHDKTLGRARRQGKRLRYLRLALFLAILFLSHKTCLLKTPACIGTPGIYGGAVACIPICAIECAQPLDDNVFNRKVYSGNFLKSLKPKAERQHALFPGRFDIEHVRNATTIGDFDDAYVAPIYGFRDKFDYYEQCGSKRYLPHIRVPHYILHALDDPFMDRQTLPSPVDVGAGTVRITYTEHGGHLGYM